MTIHAAKGLEFHAVFISGLEEGLFPRENSLTEADGIEEERRLMYVALTRARRRLYLSLAQSRMLHGQTRYGIPSRFFQEIPERVAVLGTIEPVDGEPELRLLASYAYNERKHLAERFRLRQGLIGQAAFDPDLIDHGLIRINS